MVHILKGKKGTEKENTEIMNSTVNVEELHIYVEENTELLTTYNYLVIETWQDNELIEEVYFREGKWVAE